MIEMTCGAYGGKNGLIRPGDGPFSLSAEEEERLVRRKVARYVGAMPPSGAADGLQPPIEGNDTTPPGNGTSGAADGALDIIDGHFSEAGLKRMDKAALKALAEDLGADVSACKTNADLVRVLASIEVESGEDGE